MNLEYRETDLCGRVLDDRFRLGKKLDSGGMSLLFLSEELSSHDPLVIKICKNSEEMKDFQQEITILRSLHHPGIQRIISTGTIDGLPYYVSPYYGGMNFREFLANKISLPERDMLRYFLQITNPVAYLHKRKILHNDLKPQNVLMDGDDHLILGDFGLSRRVNRHKYIRGDQKSIWGSPVYLAPELPQGLSPSYSSDVYALGIILFILVIGYPPFYHDDLDVLIRMHQTVEPPLPHLLSATISKELETIMLCAIAKLPSDRFANAQKLQDAIASYLKKNHSKISQNLIARRPETLSFDQEKTKQIE
ncbi:MAG: serine/threonine protein kinase [Anaerolineaceae bacterium]